MRSRIPFALRLVAILVLLVIVILGLIHRYRQITRNLPVILHNELTLRLKRESSIKSVKVVSFRRAVITDLRIANGKSFDQGTLLYVPRAVVNFSVSDLLLGRITTARAVSSVDLFSPSVHLVRNASGVWNVADIVKQPTPTAAKYKGIARIHSGKITISDYSAQTSKHPATNSLSNVSLGLNFRASTFLGVDGTAQGEENRVRIVRVAGAWGLKPAYTKLRINVGGAAPSYWLDYFANIKSWTLSKGNLDAHATLTQSTAGEIVVRGDGQLSNSALVSRYLSRPITPFAANLRFVGTNLSLSGKGYLDQSPINISGQIINIAHPHLNLKITSDRFNLKTVQSAIIALPKSPWLRWSGVGTAVATISGLSLDPTVTATVFQTQATINGTPFSNVIGRGYYRRFQVTLSEVTANAANGIVQGEASIYLRPFHLLGSGRIQGVNLISMHLPFKVTGIANGSFKSDYRAGLHKTHLEATVLNGSVPNASFRRANLVADGTSLRNWNVSLSATDGSARGISFVSLTANLGLMGSDILIRRSELMLPKGRVTATGKATASGPIALVVQATGVDTAALLTPLGYQQVSGIADFAGTLGGTTSNPRLTGTITARNGRIARVNYDSLTARITLTNQSVVLVDTQLTNASGQILSTGTITAMRNRPLSLNMTVTARTIQLSDLLKIAGSTVNATGLMNGTVSVKGNYPNLEVVGRVELSKANIGGERIDEAVLGVRYAGNRTVISELYARRDKMEVVGEGYITNSRDIDVRLTGKNLDLSLLNNIASPLAVFAGACSFAGQVRGNLDNPAVRGTINAVNPIINNQRFDSLNAPMAWNGTTITLSGATFVAQGTTYSISNVGYTPSTRQLSIQAAIRGAKTTAIVDLIRNSPLAKLPDGENLRRLISTVPTPFNGSIDANLDLSGHLGELNGTAGFVATNVQMRAVYLNRVEMQFVSQASAIYLNKLAVKSPGIDLAASAVFKAGEPVQFDAGLHDTQIEFLLDIIRSAPVLPAYDFGNTLLAFVQSIPAPVVGTVNASLSVSNPMSDATGTLSLTTANLSIASTPFGTVSASARLSNGSVTLDQLTITQPTGTAAVSGTINPKGIVDVHATGSNVDLSVLNPWLKGRIISGTLDFQVQAQGPYEDPFLSASFSANNISSGGRSIDSISSSSLTVAAGRISTSSLIIANKGTLVTIVGSAPFIYKTPYIPSDLPLELEVRLSDPTFNLAQNLSPYVTKSSGALSGDVMVAGTLDQPELSGSISLTDATLGIRGFVNDFTKITMTAHFQHDSLTLDNLGGESSLGGTFSANGNLSLADLNEIGNSPVSLIGIANSLRLQISNLTQSLNEKALFTITGQLLTTQSIAHPLMQGQLAVSDALVQLPANLVATSIQLPPLPINPSLSITMNLTKNVVLQRGGLRATIEGPVTFAGAFPRPVVSGNVRIVSGKLSYIGISLQIMPSGTASFYLQPPLATVITVDLTLQTTMTALSSISNRITRYMVYLDVSGPLSRPRVAVRSNPPGLTSTQALGGVFGGASLLAAQQGMTQQQLIQEQLGQVLLGLAVPALVPPLTLGPFTLALSPGFDVPLQFTASVPLNQKFTVSYSRSVVGRSPFGTFDLAYILSQHFALDLQFGGINNAPNDTALLVEYYTRFW